MAIDALYCSCVTSRGISVRLQCYSTRVSTVIHVIILRGTILVIPLLYLPLVKSGEHDYLFCTAFQRAKG